MIRVPVWKTVVEAHRFIFENRRDFVLLAFPPVLLQAVLQTAINGAFTGAELAARGEASVAQQALAWIFDRAPWLLLVVGLVSIALYVLFSVA